MLLFKVNRNTDLFLNLQEIVLRSDERNVGLHSAHLYKTDSDDLSAGYCIVGYSGGYIVREFATFDENAFLVHLPKEIQGSFENCKDALDEIYKQTNKVDWK